jgi:hypothetical protein
VFTAGEPLALMKLHELDLGKAREFFRLRYFGALWAVHVEAPQSCEQLIFGRFCRPVIYPWSCR